MRMLRAGTRVWLVGILAVVHFLSMAAQTTKPLRVYIGTYTGPKSQGIYTAEFNPETGNLSRLELAAASRNPTFLALHPKKPWLYAVEEIGNFAGKHEGGLSAYSIDDHSGKLTLMNQQPSGGSGPCHLCLDRTGNCLLAANYNSGSVASFPVDAQGHVGPVSATIQHHGSSVNADRQSGPHAHFITMDPDDRFALTCDLGLDKVFAYPLVLKPAPARLDPGASRSTAVTAGSGPRHLAFSSNGHFVYVINEMASTLMTFTYASSRGELAHLQTVSTLPEDFKGQNTCAEVQVAASGRFVYGSNRGDDSIAVFAADPKTGKLSFVQRQSTLGRTPRHFTLDPSGRWLLAENQDSNNIAVFKVDPATGQLTPTGGQLEVGAPVCLVFTTGR